MGLVIESCCIILLHRSSALQPTVTLSIRPRRRFISRPHHSVSLHSINTDDARQSAVIWGFLLENMHFWEAVWLGPILKSLAILPLLFVQIGQKPFWSWTSASCPVLKLTSTKQNSTYQTINISKAKTLIFKLLKFMVRLTKLADLYMSINNVTLFISCLSFKCN